MKTSSFLTVLVVNLLLYYGLTSINHGISYGGISLSLDVLYLVFAVFYLSLGKALIYLIIMGLLVSSASAFNFGCEMFVYLFVFAVWRFFARRLNPNTIIDVRVSSILAGFFMAILFTIFAPGDVWTEFSFWQRFLVDSVLSVLCIYLLAFRYCEFQRNLLKIENNHSIREPGNPIH